MEEEDSDTNAVGAGTTPAAPAAGAAAGSAPAAPAGQTGASELAELGPCTWSATSSERRARPGPRQGGRHCEGRSERYSSKRAQADHASSRARGRGRRRNGAASNSVRAASVTCRAQPLAPGPPKTASGASVGHNAQAIAEATERRAQKAGWCASATARPRSRARRTASASD